jgi:hypothetical protein
VEVEQQEFIPIEAYTPKGNFNFGARAILLDDNGSLTTVTVLNPTEQLDAVFKNTAPNEQWTLRFDAGAVSNIQLNRQDLTLGVLATKMVINDAPNDRRLVVFVVSDV